MRGAALEELSRRCQGPDRAAWYVRPLAIEFRILGPLEVLVDGQPRRLGGVRQRSVLAILLLDAGEVVSSDRLIEELWGERPPEDAQTALQQHVSRLRKQLEPHDVLVTRAPGYVVELAAEQLDLHRFRELAEEGRRELAAGSPDAAARILREALASWRGRPLADLEGELFARDVTKVLEEERLGALESRIDADLASGRAAELVGELRLEIQQHPLRERLRGQLMLALYRSGRQAEALDVYAETRGVLVGKLGLEPSPELRELQQAILAHDAALDAPARPVVARRRRSVIALAAALILGVAVGVSALVLAQSGESGSAPPAAPGAGEVLRIDASSGSIRRIPVGRTLSAIAVHDGVVWVVDADAQTLIRLSEPSRVLETLSTGATPTDVAAGLASAWVANGRPLESAQFIGPVATAITRVDAGTGTRRTDIDLSYREGSLSNLVDNHVAVSSTAVWAVTPDFAVVRIEPSTGAITATSRAVQAAAVAAGEAGVWVLGVDGQVLRLDERTAKPVVRTSVPGPAEGIGVGVDAVWVTSPVEGTLWRIGPGRSPVVGAIDVAPGINDVAVSADEVWIANPLAGTVVQVDIESGNVVRELELAAIPRSIAVEGDSVWVAAVAEPAASTVEVAGVHPFPGTTCEPLVAGDGATDFLVVSDLPLQGGIRTNAPQVAQAIAFVFRERGFRAGRYRVAYQSCDDSVSRTGLFDEAKCAANARAYGENPDVLGVIGTLNSSCALAAVPELNRAPGPLAMVSPYDSFVGLTRAGPGVDPRLPSALYPTGQRSYLRVYPTDDLQGAALALFARDRGRERVFVLDDGEPGYGALQADSFETAATRLGLTVAGRETWDPQASGYDALAARVAGSGAQAVYVGGLLDTNSGAVIRDLRRRLGPSVDILGPDGLTPLSLLRERAGPAALGTYVSLAGAVTEGLPPTGASFVERFGKTQPGVEVEPSAVYAAQAAEVLLDAIARSDGTRTSVLRELFETRVDDGLLGSFGFDANGDISESPVTIMRVDRGGGSKRVQSVEGGVIERVVRPTPELVGPRE